MRQQQVVQLVNALEVLLLISQKLEADAVVGDLELKFAVDMSILCHVPRLREREATESAVRWQKSSGESSAARRNPLLSRARSVQAVRVAHMLWMLEEELLRLGVESLPALDPHHSSSACRHA